MHSGAMRSDSGLRSIRELPRGGQEVFGVGAASLGRLQASRSQFMRLSSFRPWPSIHVCGVVLVGLGLCIELSCPGRPRPCALLVSSACAWVCGEGGAPSSGLACWASLRRPPVRAAKKAHGSRGHMGLHSPMRAPRPQSHRHGRRCRHRRLAAKRCPPPAVHSRATTTARAATDQAPSARHLGTGHCARPKAVDRR